MMQRLSAPAVLLFCLILVPWSSSFAESDTINFAIVNPEIGNPKTVLSSFKPLMDWMGSKVKKKIEVQIFPDVEQTVAALKEEKIDCGYLGILDFFLIQDEYPIKPMLTIVRRGSTSYSSCLLVRIEDKDKALADFKGKNFGFTSFHKAIGGLYPQIFLLENGFGNDLGAFFSTVNPYFSDVTGITDLIKRSIDICAVTTATLDTLKITSPGLLKNVHIINQQDGLMFAPFFYRASLDETLRNKIIEETLSFAKTIEGRQLLMMFKVDGIQPVVDEDYAADRARADKLGYLKKQHPKAKP